MRDRIGVINGLRGYAILAVIYHHMFYRFTPPGWHSVEIGGFTFLPFTFLANGWLGVNLFFVLSGFVLFLPYAAGKRHISGRADVLAFYRHRAARLLPLYFLSLFVAWVFYSRGRVLSRGFAREFLLMVTCTFPFTKDMWAPPVNWVLWSLGIEIWFSVLFPFLVLACRRIGAGRLLAGLLVVSLATRWLGTVLAGVDIGSLLLNPLKDSLIGRLDDFALGMLLAGEMARGFPSFRLPAALALAGALLAIAAGCSTWDLLTLGRLSKTFVPFTNNVFQLGFYLLIVALLPMRAGIVRSLFDNRPLQVMGMMSYSLYVWHGIAQVSVLKEDISLERIVVHLVLLAGLSLLTYRFVEFGKHPDARELFLLEPSFRLTPPSCRV